VSKIQSGFEIVRSPALIIAPLLNALSPSRYELDITSAIVPCRAAALHTFTTLCVWASG
jgi:hypothetical protein